MGPGLALLFVYVGMALAISFICSILEATLLSARLSELSARASHGDRGAAILLHLKTHRIDAAISSILTLNTIAHTIGAALAGAQAAIVFGDKWLGVFSGILTFLVLIFTEIIPKTLGTVHASRLAGIVGRVTALLIRILAPVVFITHAMTRFLQRGEKEPVSRAELAALVAMATREGTLEGVESRVVDNVLKLDRITVADIMTPRPVARMLPEDMSLGEALIELSRLPFSRLPIYGAHADEVRGYVVRSEVLAAIAGDADRQLPLSTYRRPAWSVRDDASLIATLGQFLRRREHLALVTDTFGTVVGLVTLEDIVETILGAEIIDELDNVPDMRALAIELRDKRAARTDPDGEVGSS